MTVVFGPNKDKCKNAFRVRIDGRYSCVAAVKIVLRRSTGRSRNPCIVSNAVDTRCRREMLFQVVLASV